MAYTTIDNPELHFQCKIYSGNSSTQAITLDGDENMQPDFVWIKNRNDGNNQAHVLYDSVRGATKFMQSASTAAEATDSSGLTAFGTDGFTLGNSVEENTGFNYVAWCWKGGTTSGITTNGSTTITPSAYSFNADAGIAILQYTGNSTAGAKLAHGIGGCDAFWIKRTPTAGDDWRTYNRVLGGTKNIKLNSDDPAATGTNIFNDTDPDSVNITLGSHNSANASEAMICYAFKSIQGFSKVGSVYEGNGNADGTFVYTGFRPAFLLVTNADASGCDWVIYDNKRSGYNGDNRLVYPSLTNVEEAGSALPIDFLSNGFKPRTTANLVNSTDTFAYVAFAEAPFVNSNGVPNNAR
tara:strand:+ start:1788 stop:2846 length:1059 start_codon:yes stop_codon:yes gene_type:complete